jgi:hypothetical protein
MLQAKELFTVNLPSITLVIESKRRWAGHVWGQERCTQGFGGET